MNASIEKLLREFLERARVIAERERINHIARCELISEPISFVGVPDYMECFWNLCINEFDLDKNSPETILELAIELNVLQKQFFEKHKINWLE
jgi:hypothetical protein